MKIATIIIAVFAGMVLIGVAQETAIKDRLGNVYTLATTTIDHSGSITTGGTSQMVLGPNSARKRILIENPCSATSQNIGAAENLFINFGTAAASTSAGNSIELLPCGTFDPNPPVPTDQINIVATTTSHQYTIKEMQ